MKKYEIGNIVKTKEGDKCIILDFIDNKILVFNMSEMHPDEIKENDIAEKIGEINNTTVIVNGKRVDHNEKEENDKNETEDDEDIEKKFAELIKTFGKAAIELGEIFVKISESDKEE